MTPKLKGLEDGPLAGSPMLDAWAERYSPPAVDAIMPPRTAPPQHPGACTCIECQLRLCLEMQREELERLGAELAQSLAREAQSSRLIAYWGRQLDGVSVREAARRALPLGGASAQALEGALEQVERELEQTRTELRLAQASAATEHFRAEHLDHEASALREALLDWLASGVQPMHAESALEAGAGKALLARLREAEEALPAISRGVWIAANYAHRLSHGLAMVARRYWAQQQFMEGARASRDEYARQRDALRTAIAKHHAARGMDRRWEADQELYRAAGLEPGNPERPPIEEHRRACDVYRAGLYGVPVEGEPQPQVQQALADASMPDACEECGTSPAMPFAGELLCREHFEEAVLLDVAEECQEIARRIGKERAGCGLSGGNHVQAAAGWIAEAIAQRFGLDDEGKSAAPAGGPA